jgi:hypothetical protein
MLLTANLVCLTEPKLENGLEMLTVCATGMVGVINPPTGETQSDFAQKAGDSLEGSQPNNVVGGTLVAGGKTSVGASATAGAGSPSSSGSASMTTAASGKQSGSVTATAAGTGSSSSMGAAALASAAPAALALVAGALAYI